MISMDYSGSLYIIYTYILQKNIFILQKNIFRITPDEGKEQENPPVYRFIALPV